MTGSNLRQQKKAKPANRVCVKCGNTDSPEWRKVGSLDCGAAQT